MGKSWTIVSPVEEIQNALERYLRYVLIVEDIKKKSLDYFIQDLADDKILIDDNRKFLIDFYIFDRKEENIMDYRKSILHDPFYYPICDLLAAVLFDERFYKDDKEKNHLLCKTFFFSYFKKDELPSDSLIKDIIKMNYLEFPDMLNDLLEDPKPVTIDKEMKEDLLKEMQEALKDAFEPHGEKINA